MVLQALDLEWQSRWAASVEGGRRNWVDFPPSSFLCLRPALSIRNIMQATNVSHRGNLKFLVATLKKKKETCELNFNNILTHIKNMIFSICSQYENYVCMKFWDEYVSTFTAHLSLD